MPRIASITLLAMAAALPLAASAEDKAFRAVLVGTQEVPSVSTAAHGGFILKEDLAGYDVYLPSVTLQALQKLPALRRLKAQFLQAQFKNRPVF